MHDRPRFIDTNIWLYAFIRSSDHRKTTAAHTVIEKTRIITSSQVINEVCVNLLKKTEMGESAIAEIIAAFYNRYDIIEPSKTILLQASTLRGTYNFSYWDSLIVSSALQANAEVLYSDRYAQRTHRRREAHHRKPVTTPLIP